MTKTYSCVCSGKKLFKNEALRFVASPYESAICLDLEFDLQGNDVIVAREASLIPLWNNLTFFEKHFGFAPDLESLRLQIFRQFHRKILTFIALAKKSGRVQLGKMQVECRLKGKKNISCLIVQAIDASEREKFKDSGSVALLELFDSSELSATLGKLKLHYLLIEGDFVPLIMDLAGIYKIFKEYK